MEKFRPRPIDYEYETDSSGKAPEQPASPENKETTSERLSDKEKLFLQLLLLAEKDRQLSLIKKLVAAVLFWREKHAAQQ